MKRALKASFLCAGLVAGLAGCKGEPPANANARSMAYTGSSGAAAASTAAFQVAIATNGSGNGAVQIDPPAASYPAGTSITLTAVADTGFVFLGWRGDLAGQTQNPAVVTVTADLNVEAEFGPPSAGTPDAAFTTDPVDPAGVAPFTVAFIDSSSRAPTSWAWDFGDGETSTEENPTHTYMNPGTYTVRLVATNANGPSGATVRQDFVVVVDASAGSRHWYENDTYGNAYKVHTAAEAQFAQQVLDIVNQERTSRGLNPVQFDAEAELVAKIHSEDMAGRNFFDHVTPEGWTPGDRLRMTGAAGYTMSGENVAYGQQDAAAVMQAWMNSPPHRANILEPNFTHLGVGVAEGRPHWTQIFLRR